jgi:hypothetical protein
MERNKQKARFFWLLSIILLGAMPAKSNDLYVYQTDGSKQAISLDNVRKLTFSDTEMLINKKTGETTSVLFTDLNCFSLFGNLYSGTNIVIPFLSSQINVYTDLYGKQAIVKSTQDITGVSLYNLQGQKLLQLQPATREISIPLNLYPSGVYILRVVDKDGTTVKKIMKN